MIAALIADDERPLEEAIAATMALLEGAATVVGLADGKLFAFRDRYGFRPLVLGRLGDDPVVASETCALDLVGAKFEREVAAGRARDRRRRRRLHRSRRSSRPSTARSASSSSSTSRAPTRGSSGVEVHGARVRMGERLAQESPVEADLVLPIPDSGTPAAIGFARAAGIPFSEGLIKNRYVGRTFIQPEQGMREQGIRMKFNPLAEVSREAPRRRRRLDRARLDDAPDRADALRRRRGRGARAHLVAAGRLARASTGSTSPSEDEMIAAHSTVEEVREAIGATSLAYISLDGLQAATQRPAAALCRACLTREYPTRVPADAAKLRFEPATSDAHPRVALHFHSSSIPIAS